MIDYLPTARKFLQESASFALTSQGKLKTTDITFKEGDRNNVLTEVDLAISRNIQTALKPFLDAGDILIDEENLPSGTPEEIFASGKPIWILDPVDGTRPFSLGETSFGTMLSRWEDDHFTFTGVHMPALKAVVEYTDDAIEVTAQNQPLESLNPDLIPVTVNPRLTKLQEHLNATGQFENSYKPSAAEMTLLYVQGERQLVGIPNKAGIWDVAPIATVIQDTDDCMFFESEPSKLLSFGPHLFGNNWQLKDHLIICTAEIYETLYQKAA